MRIYGSRSIWECAKLLRYSCPNREAPAMRLVTTLVQEMLADMNHKAIDEDESPCGTCSFFVSKNTLRRREDTNAGNN